MRTQLEIDKLAYQRHKGRAKKQNKGWFFTFEEWVAWWEIQLGPNWRNLRGKRRGQYVMARFGDKGPYHPDNIECITCGQNIKDAVLNGANRGKGIGRKLNAQQVKLIYASKATQCALAIKYGVSERLIRLIKNKQVWSTVL